MQNQGKRLLLAVGLALIVMLGWNMIFPPDKPADAPKPTPAGTQVAPARSLVGAPEESPGGAPGVRAELQCGPEHTITLSFPDKFAATFCDDGGVLTSWKLAESKFQKAPSKGEMLPGPASAFLVDFVRSDGAGRQQRATYVVPPDATWVGEKLSDTEVRYRTETPTIEIEKIFTIVPDAYLVKMTVRAKVKVPVGQEANQNLVVSAFGYQDPKVDLEGGTNVAARIWNSSTMVAGETRHTNVKQVAAAPRWEKDIAWTGFEHPYMLVAYSPNAENVEKFTFGGTAEGVMRTDIVFPTNTIKHDSPTIEKTVAAYLGPKSYETLERADAAAGFATGFKETIDFGWFGVIGRPLLWLLQKFYALFGNWGIAIMLLTLLVKAATLYWTTKSMRSMKAMAALAPQMKGLQEKYKDDRQRLQAETMALYKQHSVNPIAGCLPILLQMPIWIALYRMLSNAGELFHAPFIPGWIDDLTATDPFHVLPIVLMVTMFAQARLTPVTGDSRQQKFLQYGMPLMFGVMSFFFPAGLTLYIFTNTILSAFHSIYMNKYDKKSIALVAKMKKNAEAAAAAKTAPAGDGKAAKAGSGKPGKAGGKNGKSTTPSKAPAVIDVESSEVAGADAGDEDDAEVPAATAGGGSTSSTGPARPRKRKKRRR